jgi:hypothetical protein
LKTASFYTYTGPGRISIARFAPRNTPAGFRIYKPLAPGPWFNKTTEPEYRKLYFAQLAELDVVEVVETLEKLAAGAEPVLLCYEKPSFTASNWCHRRMVAEWLKTEAGICVKEIGGCEHV